LKNLVKHLLPHQKIASIGCGGGLWEIAWAFELDNVHFYLQEINESLLNEIEVENTIQYFEKKYNKTTNCTFKIVIGNSKKTKLPTNFFDKVLLINSLHEFEEQPIMLAECHRILKPNGQLVIEEQLAQYTGELHKGCGKRLFLEEELIQIVKKSGFQLCESQIFENKMYKIFNAIL
jgi:ubiquinone/menaquinone biosynthesis C-methylase UbiE